MTQVAYGTSVLGLLGIVLVILLLVAWWALKSKHVLKPIRAILACLVVIFVLAVFWVEWKFQPWMPAGRAVQLSRERIGDYDVQVWQRKNAGLSEPFATALFIRKQGGEWRAFLLDFEDTYRPSVNLRKENSGILVLRDNSRWGHFDEAREVLQRDSNGSEVDGIVINANPPGNWWLRQSSMP